MVDQGPKSSAGLGRKEERGRVRPGRQVAGDDVGPSIIRSRGVSLDSEGRRIVEHLGGEWRHDGGMCLCPAHANSKPSLSVRPGSYRLLFHCFSGCAVRDIIRELAAQQLLTPARAAPQAEEPSAARCGRCNRGAAAAVWAASRPIERSPAEDYSSEPRPFSAGLRSALQSSHPLWPRAADAVPAGLDSCCSR